jgi:hypothetical protein
MGKRGTDHVFYNARLTLRIRIDFPLAAVPVPPSRFVYRA